MEKNAPKVMKFKDYFSDSLGQMSINIIGIMTGQLTYFYTNKVGISAAAAGTILLVARIFDAVTDIVMGKMVDAGKSPKGKTIPWLSRMLIPVPLCIILMFTVPRLSAGFMTGYGILTNVFASAICYTAVCVPYYALINYTTKNQEERGIIGVARQVASYVAGYGITITILPVTNALGGDQRAWIIYACIWAVISFVALFICYKGAHERYPDDEGSQEKESEMNVLQGIGILFKNTYWLKFATAGLLMQIMYAMITNAPVYYAQYVLGNENLYSVLNMIGLAASLAGFALTPVMIKKFGMVGSAKMSLIIGILGCVIRASNPTSLAFAMVSNIFIMFGTIAPVSNLPILIVNSIEYNKYKFDVSLCGLATSGNSFAAKIGAGLGSAIIGWVLAFGGFDASLAQQPASSIASIYALNFYMPIAMFAIMFIILHFCDMDKKYEFFVAENQKKGKVE